VQGKGAHGNAVLEAANQLEAAGAFSIVLELIPGDLASDVTAGVGIPTIGIGAGPCCDGQIQVMHDVLGLSNQTFKHAKRFAEGEQVLMEGNTPPRFAESLSPRTRTRFENRPNG
jgi:3-methyl-2-oxobutanoate hydroxymethyltransferase